MKLTTALAALSTLVPGTSASAIPSKQASEINKRTGGNCPNGTCGTVPIAEFHTYTASECQKGDYYGHYFIYKGQDSPTCQSLIEKSGVTVHSVSQTFGNFKCQLTVYTTPDCTDRGLDIGAPQPGAPAGCFSDVGGIKAYKIQCPWWNS